MAIFDKVYDEYLQYVMKMLYNSDAFFRAAYNKMFKVFYHGVIRKGGHGIPGVLHLGLVVVPITRKNNIINIQVTDCSFLNTVDSNMAYFH